MDLINKIREWWQEFLLCLFAPKSGDIAIQYRKEFQEAMESFEENEGNPKIDRFYIDKRYGHVFYVRDRLKDDSDVARFNTDDRQLDAFLAELSLGVIISNFNKEQKKQD